MKGKGFHYLLHLVTAILFAISMAGCTNSKRAIISGETGENVALPWLTDGQFTPPARELLDVVRNAQRYGLNPTSYNMEEIEKDIASSAQISSANARSAETALTKLFYTFGKDMLNGSLDPKKITVGFEAARERISLQALQESSIRENTVRSTLESLLPRHPEYLRLQDALASYRLILRAGGWGTVPWGPELKRGDSGGRVLSLKQRLAASGDLVPGDNIGSQDFDETLELAVRHFQKRHGLESSGIVETLTLRELNLPVEVRIRQLELNMERWRWLPRQMGDLHILVDIAGFQLRLIKKNRVVMASPVIVGQPNWQTEVFNSKIKSFVLNPCWVIPESIAISEMVPQIRENLRFLAENKIEVEKGPEHTHNNSIDPMTVDWKQVGSGKPEFILVQKKGGTNPMGVIKFIVSDNRSIYIHDTPQKELFKNEVRLFSHGCVRMKDPLKLAAYLAGSDDLTSAEREITEKIMIDEEVTIPLKNPVPVYFAYLTATVDEEGTLYFRPDVYGHDIPLYRAMLANNMFTD